MDILWCPEFFWLRWAFKLLLCKHRDHQMACQTICQYLLKTNIQSFRMINFENFLWQHNRQKFNLQSNLVSHIIRTTQQWKMYCFATYQWPTEECLVITCIHTYIHIHTHTHTHRHTCIIFKHVPFSDQGHATRYFISSNTFI